MVRRAVYAGSFDPVTEGHLDIIHRGAALYDELVIAVGNNPAKRYMFDLAARERFVRVAAHGVKNVSVVSFEGLLVHTAQEVGAGVILRGLRALSDFELEFRNGLANRDLSGIETVFLISAPERIFVSSSLVKEIALHGGDVSRYVPKVVLDELTARAFDKT